MLGGKLTKKRKAEAAAVEEAATNGKVDETDNGGRSNERHPKTPPEPRPKKPAGLLDDLRGGGPVERAIRSDLENLRTLFDDDCIRHEASLVAASARAAGGDATTCVAQHDDAGSWYLSSRAPTAGESLASCTPDACPIASRGLNLPK